MSELEDITLMPEEVEAIKLCDAEGLRQEDAAKRMQVSQPTFNRALNNARAKVATALTKGKALSLEVSEK